MSHDHMPKVGNRCLYARNLIELAEAIGVSLFEIKEWKAIRGFPNPKRDGRWEIHKVRAWASELDLVDAQYSELNGILYEQLKETEIIIPLENFKRNAKALNKSLKETQDLLWNISVKQNQAYAQVCTENKYKDFEDFAAFLISDYYFSFSDFEKLVELLMKFKRLPEHCPKVLSYITEILNLEELNE